MRAIDMLIEEHELILRGLDLLDQAARQASTNHPPEVTAVRDLLDFFLVFADRCHHAKEEGALFPRLGERGIPCPGGPVGMMLCEHVQGRALRARMVKTLERWEDANARSEFARAAWEFVDLLRAHIQKENQVLFQMANRVLSTEDDRDLTTVYEKHERDVVGSGVHEEYHRRIADLEKRLTEQPD